MPDRTLTPARPARPLEASRYQGFRAVLEEAHAFRAFLEMLSERVPTAEVMTARREERRGRLERVDALLRELRAHLEAAQRVAAEAGVPLPPEVAEGLHAAGSRLLEAHWLARQTSQRGRTATRLLDTLAIEGERLERSALALRDLGLETGSLASGRALVA